MKNNRIDFSINFIVKNVIEFRVNVIDRSQKIYDALIKFLDEHKILTQLYKIVAKNIDTFNSDLKTKRKITKI